MEHADNAFQAFLESQQKQGRYFDSSEFTLDTLKAREKLGRFQLADSGLWLVKLVQAAVACGAPSITVSFGRSEVKVSFENRAEWQADAVLKEVLAGTLAKDNALAHLVTGLRASASSSTEIVVWSCGDVVVSLDSEGSEISPHESHPYFELIATRPSRTRSLSKTLGSSVSHLVRQTVEEYEAVTTRCWACPISIVLDGKKLQRGYGLPHAGKIQRGPFQGAFNFQMDNKRVSGCLGLRPLDGIEGRPEFDYLQPQPVAEGEQEYHLTKPVYLGELFLNYGPSRQRCRGVAALMAGFQVESRVELLLDGVIVKTLPFAGWTPPPKKVLGMATTYSFPLAVRLFFEVDRRELDLSEFEVRDIDLQSILDQSLPEVMALLEAVQSQAGQFWYIPISRAYSKWAGAGISGHLALTVAVSKGAALAPISLAVGLGIGLNTVIYRSQVTSPVKRMLKFLEEELVDSMGG